MVKKKTAKKAVKAGKPAKRKAPAKKAAKIAVKKAAAKKTAQAKPAPVPAYPKLQIAGEVTHFFPHVSAGVIKLSGDLKINDVVNIKGHTTDFKQTIDSMQIDHVPVTEAKKGQEIGIKVKDRVRIGDTVYKL